MFMDLPDGIAAFNSYEVEGSPGLVATFVTKVLTKDIQRHKNSKAKLDTIARLDSIVLADAAYLDALWGEEKTKDGKYKAIRWEAVREPFEGLWAETEAECLDEEGPKSRTLIDLRNMVEGKRLPLFDQYENHCRIEDVIRSGFDFVLKASCYEFWQNLNKDEDRQDGLIELSIRSAPSLEINGRKFQLCKPL
jgi:hypothetical protein